MVDLCESLENVNQYSTVDYMNDHFTVIVFDQLPYSIE